MSNPNWTMGEDLVACHIYATKDKKKKLVLMKQALKMLDRSPGALRNKIGNIQYVATNDQKGRENTSRVDYEAWDYYCTMSESDIRILEESLLSDYPEIKSFFRKTEDAPTSGYDVIAECKSRRGQSELRQKCLELAGNKCMVTGISCPTLLIASHIKPWRHCTSSEKTDVHNVLCLSPLYDALFDRHLMTVYPDMTIRFSPKLREFMGEQEYQNFIERYTKISINENNKPDEKYLRIHNKAFEEKL